MWGWNWLLKTPPPEPHPTDETPREPPAKESTDIELNLATFPDLYGPEEEVA